MCASWLFADAQLSQKRHSQIFPDFQAHENQQHICCIYFVQVSLRLSSTPRFKTWYNTTAWSASKRVVLELHKSAPQAHCHQMLLGVHRQWISYIQDHGHYCAVDHEYIRRHYPCPLPDTYRSRRTPHDCPTCSARIHQRPSPPVAQMVHE